MQDIQQILDVLRGGGAMLYPTDTLWGIGCDATNEKAVAKVFEIKKRAPSKSLIVLVDGEDMLDRYVRKVPEIARTVVALSTTPLTVIYPEGVGFARGVCAPNGAIAIRVVDHDFCRQIIRKLGRPIVSTSANLAGEKAPENFSEISEEVKSSVDVTVSEKFEGAPTRQASSIIQLSVDGQVRVIR
ncbi:MAG: threonylcarbamoyl-AMP synthase [Prevotellaceae bacterium]|jgi:L-threonylcarbamoyladenylate synthase|nr:threonylcarbamoyl-AMP synthase [Prevotellaceae bacterium]